MPWLWEVLALFSVPEHGKLQGGALEGVKALCLAYGSDTNQL